MEKGRKEGIPMPALLAEIEAYYNDYLGRGV
jgi:hypothetical protein